MSSRDNLRLGYTPVYQEAYEKGRVEVLERVIEMKQKIMEIVCEQHFQYYDKDGEIKTIWCRTTEPDKSFGHICLKCRDVERQFRWVEKTEDSLK